MPPPEDQYHHYIPRFILRRFRLQNTPIAQNKKNRKRHGQIDNQEMVYYYDLGTGKLEIRPIAQVYGIVNLYKDAKNPNNVHHLEEKLSVLESQAATVIRKVHHALGRGSFQIQRRDLDALRKFIQIMIYRKQTSYFDEDNPGNAPCAGFMKALREGKGLDRGIEVWLHFLDFLLNTPHNDLVNRAAKFKKKDWTFGISTILRSIFGSWWPTNITAEDFVAYDYSYLADHFYLGIVEAAAGTEFIMSNNTFGLWEGTMGMNGSAEAHRLFIISPRIAFILRSNLLNEDIPFSKPLVVRSSLIDIPLKTARISYANGHQAMTMEELYNHRGSPAGQRDQVKFKITKLTKQQTQDVNTIVLVNSTGDGSITFLSKSIMRTTLESYMKLIAETEGRYLSLFDQLINDGIPATSNHHAVTESVFERLNNLGPESNDALPHLSESGIGWQANTPMGTMLLRDICSGNISFKSDYDRAYQAYWAALENEKTSQYVLTNVGILLDVAIDRIFKTECQRVKFRSHVVPIRPLGTLVETLPIHQSAKVMDKVRMLIADIRVTSYHDPGMNDILHDATIIGMLHWFAREVTFMITVVLFPGVPLIR